MLHFHITSEQSLKVSLQKSYFHQFMEVSLYTVLLEPNVTVLAPIVVEQ